MADAQRKEQEARGVAVLHCPPLRKTWCKSSGTCWYASASERSGQPPAGHIAISCCQQLFPMERERERQSVAQPWRCWQVRPVVAWGLQAAGTAPRPADPPSLLFRRQLMPTSLLLLGGHVGVLSSELSVGLLPRCRLWWACAAVAVILLSVETAGVWPTRSQAKTRLASVSSSVSPLNRHAHSSQTRSTAIPSSLATMRCSHPNAAPPTRPHPRARPLPSAAVSWVTRRQRAAVATRAATPGRP